MATSHATSLELKAPETLGLETRDSIRRDAIKVLDEMPVGNGRLLIDLANTRSVDSAGLGALMLIQRHAAERRQSVVLSNINDELRFLLMLTKLDELFELVAADA
ncbi:MAG: STAS domain-containing protein [Gemmatimonadales bacterium]